MTPAVAFSPWSTNATSGTKPNLMLEADNPSPTRVLMVAAEFDPFAKTGGLADVLASLPKALARRGLDIRVAIPRYGSVDLTGVSRRPGIARFDLPFNGRQERVRLDAVEVDGFEVLLIDNEHYVSARPAIYGYPDDGHRFTFFARAALETARVLDWRPDVIHCHDWHTGLIPNWLRTTDRHAPEFADTASVFTIHNLEYQGHFDSSVLETAGLAPDGLIPHPTRADLSDILIFMSRGILFADKINTVSPRYAGEILTPDYGHDLDPVLRDRESDLHGILNGIDTETANPATDPHLASHYTIESLEQRAPNKTVLQQAVGLPVRPDAPLLGLVTRLAEHKGLDLLLASLPHMLDRGAQVVVLGIGEPRYEEALREAALAHPDQVAAAIRFDARLASLVYAGSDIFLMPSRHEPCGLGQLFAMRYGSVPVVRATGGLADTVDDFDPINGTGDGFVFHRYDPIDFFGAVARALEVYRFPDAWRQIVRRGMARDSSWDVSAAAYERLYAEALTARRTQPSPALATVS